MMLPDVTNNQKPLPQPKSENEGAFDAYVSYCALGGLLTDDDGTPRQMKLTEFCETYGVTRMTLSRWKRQTPDWADKVSRRRNEIMPLARVTQVWNSMYLISRQTTDRRAAVEAGKVILGHNGLQLPIQRQDVKMEGNFLDMIAAAAREGVIEGEVVPNDPVDAQDAYQQALEGMNNASDNEPQTDAGRSGQDSGVLPNPS